MRLLPPILLVLAGCSQTPNDIVTNTDGGTESDSGADSLGSVATDSGTDETGADDTGVSGGEVPASGIELRNVITNQGVQIPVWTEEGWVGPAERNGPLVPGRGMLVRAGFELDDSFAPRLVEGRLHVLSGDDEEVFSASLDPTTDTDSAFEWFLEGASSTTGSEFYIDVIEVEPEVAPDPPPAEPTRLPDEGSALFGFEAVGPVARIVGVPLHHVVGDCDQPFLLDDSQVYGWWFGPVLLPMLPVVDLVATMRDPVETSATTAAELFLELEALREADGENDKTLYFGYILACPDTLGLAAFYDAEDGLGISVGEPTGEPQDPADGGLVQTYGVTHGLGNVSCEDPPVGPGPIDPYYPYPNGEIGVPGYNIQDHVDIPADATTFMSVDCGDGEWISDYEWGNVYESLTE